MNGGVVFLIIIGIVAILAIVFVAIFAGGRSETVRRKEFDLMRRERNAAWQAVDRIAEACEEYKDIDSPLAAKVRPIIVGYQKERLEFRK